MADLITSANVDTLMQAADFATFRTSLGLTALATTTPGTGVATALAQNIGSAGAPILFNGAGGTPSSMVGTNITGTAAGLTAGTASAVAVGGITGLGSGVGTFLATPSSANLAAAVTGETGSGALVFGTSPAFTTNFTLANGASPTTSSVAQMAFDTDAWAASRGAAQTFFPFRDIAADVDPTTNRDAETETVDSETTDLVVHVIADVLVSRGTLGSGETSRSVANDGTDDASLWISTKPGEAGTTTVSSSGWANTFPLGGVAFSVMPAGTAETYDVAEDDFTRANEDPVSNGGMWSSPVGSGTTAMEVVSNQLAGTTAGENMARIATPAFPDDQYVEMIYVGAQFGGVCARIQSSSNASCYILSSNGVNAVQVYKITDTAGSLSYSQIGADFAVSGVRGLIAGDRLGLQVTGGATTTLDFYWNGMLFGSRTDSSSPYTSGQPGVRAFGADATAAGFLASSLPVRFP